MNRGPCENSSTDIYRTLKVALPQAYPGVTRVKKTIYTGTESCSRIYSFLQQWLQNMLQTLLSAHIRLAVGCWNGCVYVLVSVWLCIQLIYLKFCPSLLRTSFEDMFTVRAVDSDELRCNCIKNAIVCSIFMFRDVTTAYYSTMFMWKQIYLEECWKWWWTIFQFFESGHGQSQIYTI